MGKLLWSSLASALFGFRDVHLLLWLKLWRNFKKPNEEKQTHAAPRWQVPEQQLSVVQILQWKLPNPTSARILKIWYIACENNCLACGCGPLKCNGMFHYNSSNSYLGTGYANYFPMGLMPLSPTLTPAQGWWRESKNFCQCRSHLLSFLEPFSWWTTCPTLDL